MVTKCADKNTLVIETYAKTCDFFMVPKNDEMREKSDKFFEFFIGFLEDVSKNVPKVEKKTTKKPAAASKQKSAQAAMMAEMKAKMAAKK